MVIMLCFAAPGGQGASGAFCPCPLPPLTLGLGAESPLLPPPSCARPGLMRHSQSACSCVVFGAGGSCLSFRQHDNPVSPSFQINTADLLLLCQDQAGRNTRAPASLEHMPLTGWLCPHGCWLAAPAQAQPNLGLHANPATHVQGSPCLFLAQESRGKSLIGRTLLARPSWWPCRVWLVLVSTPSFPARQVGGQ